MNNDSTPIPTAPPTIGSRVPAPLTGAQKVKLRDAEGGYASPKVLAKLARKYPASHGIPAITVHPSVAPQPRTNDQAPQPVTVFASQESAMQAGWAKWGNKQNQQG